MTGPQGADAPMLSDAFMAFRLLMGYLDDLAMAIDSQSRVRTIVDGITGGVTLSNVTTVGTVSSVSSVSSVASVTSVGSVSTVSTLQNLVSLGGIPALAFVSDNMYLLWATAIRPRII